MDAALLREGGYQVPGAERRVYLLLPSQGIFYGGVGLAAETYRPDVELIEPSGVGKLSDVERACRDRRFATSARITQKLR